MIIKLRRPIKAGEQEITEVNLDGLDKLTGGDVLFCRKEASVKIGTPVIYGGLDDTYRLEVTAKASGISVEVLKTLWAPDFEEVDATVRSFLMGLDSV